jgi:hypothetical protein
VVERRNALTLFAPYGRCHLYGLPESHFPTEPENSVKVVLLGLVGLFFGAILGGTIGVVAGLAWTQVFNTSCFEGYCGMLVFLAFMPVGMALGGLAGAAALGHAASRDSKAGRAE